MSRGVRAAVLVLALALAPGLAACGPEDGDGVLRQDDYAAIDLSRFEERPSGRTPEAAMAALVGEAIEFEELSHGGQGVVLRAVQLDRADDSVAGVRTVAIILPHADGHWTVGWAGRQVKCWEGRGHDDWSKEPCL